MKPTRLYLDEAIELHAFGIVPRECLQPTHGHIVASVPPCWESQDQGVTRECLQRGGFWVKVVRVEVVKVAKR